MAEATSVRDDRQQEPDDTIRTADVRSNFSDIVNRAAYRKERVIITRHGKPIAAIIPIEDLDRLPQREQ
jgi:prevent-host-death family protein